MSGRAGVNGSSCPPRGPIGDAVIIGSVAWPKHTLVADNGLAIPWSFARGGRPAAGVIVAHKSPEQVGYEAGRFSQRIYCEKPCPDSRDREAIDYRVRVKADLAVSAHRSQTLLEALARWCVAQTLLWQMTTSPPGLRPRHSRSSPQRKRCALSCGFRRSKASSANSIRRA